MIKEIIDNFKKGFIHGVAEKYVEKKIIKPANDLRDFFIEKEIFCLSQNGEIIELTDKGIEFMNYCKSLLNKELIDKPCNMDFEDIIDDMPAEYMLKNKQSYNERIDLLNDMFNNFKKIPYEEI